MFHKRRSRSIYISKFMTSKNNLELEMIILCILLGVNVLDYLYKYKYFNWIVRDS